MIKSLAATTALLVLLAGASTSAAQDNDAPIVTGARNVEAADALRLREALAYSNPLPRGAPEADYALVAWCDAQVTGHIALGESLNTTDPLDLDLIRLGRLEAADFRTALTMAGPRQSAESRAAAQAAAAQVASQWAPLMEQDDAVRGQAFGLFFGLPGRCEHAARRLRDNITTPPATPADVGLEEGGAG